MSLSGFSGFSGHRSSFSPLPVSGRGVWIFLSILALFLLPSAAFAACSSPTGVAGEIVYNQDSHVHQYCNNTDWIAMASNSGDGGSGATPTTSGLIGYWKLDDGSGTTATDSAGSNNGTLTNSPTWTTGKISGAVQFDGTNDYIDIPHSASLDVSSGYTIAGWIKFNSATKNYDPIYSKNDNGFWGSRLVLSRSNAGGAVLWGNVRLSLAHNGTEIYTNWAFPYQTLFHLTVTWDGSNVNFYVNGSFVENGTLASVPTLNTGSANLGRGSINWAPYNFDGLIDDFRIYNRVLSTTEIQQLYNYGQIGGGAGCLAPAGVEGTINFNSDSRKLQYCDGDEWRAMGTCGEDPESSKVAHWKLDESSGTSAADSTTNSLTGTLTNGPVWQSTGGQVNGALSFDGSNDYVTIPDPGTGSVLDFTTGDSITVMAWINPTSVAGERIITCKGATTGAVDHNYCLFQDTGKLYFGYDDSGGTFHGFGTTAIVLGTGAWQHVAASFIFNSGSSADGKLYYNGSEFPVTTLGSNVYTTAPVVQDRPQWLGAYNPSGSPTSVFSGSIDDMRIYRRILSSTDIKTIYTQGKYNNLDNGKVAHWPLDESAGTTVADLVGVSPGTAVNSPTWVPTGGQVGGAMDFDGADDRVDVGSDATLDNLSALTIVAWIKPDTLGEGPSLGRIIGKTSSAGTTTTGGWTLNLDTTNRLTFDVDYNTTDFRRRAANNSITLGQWQQVAVTWTGSATASTSHLYINGVETSYATTTNGTGGRADDSAQSISIGNPPGRTDRTFDGKIDNVRIYNRALSSAEISALYDITVSGNGCSVAGEILYDATLNVMKHCDGRKWRGFGNCTGDATDTIAQWKFDETSGTSASDSSGNSLTGTLTNGPVWSSGSLTFDGTDDYVSVPDPGTGSVLDFTTGDSITITAWINPDSTAPSYAMILSKNGTTSANTVNYQFETAGDALALYFTNSGSWHGLVTSAGIISAGSWQFVAFTGTFGMLQSAKIYVNGVPFALSVDSGSPYTTAPNVANEPLWIGAENAGAFFGGKLDDIRIYRRILSSEELQNLYLKGQ